jgi:hypothetical protein
MNQLNDSKSVLILSERQGVRCLVNSFDGEVPVEGFSYLNWVKEDSLAYLYGWKVAVLFPLIEGS